MKFRKENMFKLAIYGKVIIAYKFQYNAFLFKPIRIIGTIPTK